MKELKNMSSLCSPWAIKKLGLDRNHKKGYVFCTPRLIALFIIFQPFYTKVVLVASRVDVGFAITKININRYQSKTALYMYIIAPLRAIE